MLHIFQKHKAKNNQVEYYFSVVNINLLFAQYYRCSQLQLQLI